MSLLAQAVIAAILFAAGLATGIKWELGVQAREQLAAADVRATDAKRQIKTIDKASAAHTSAMATINTQLGAAREQIGKLSDRKCLSADSVGMLNAIGADPVPAAASGSASAPAAPAAGGGLRFATERDTARAIAQCRAGYATLASQVNRILDIEEARVPP